MPPRATSKTAVKSAGNLHSFFGTPKTTGQSDSIRSKPSGSSPTAAIAISDSDNEAPSKKVKPSMVSTVKRKRVLLSDDDDDEPTVKSPPKKKSVPASLPNTKYKALDDSKKSARKIKTEEEEFELSEDDEPAPKKSSVSAKPRVSAGRKRAPSSSKEEAGTTDEDSAPKKKKAVAKPRASTSAAATQKKSTKGKKIESDDEMELEDKPKPKPKFTFKPKAPGPAPNSGSKTPSDDAHPAALAGLTIVFTGDLPSFSRDEVKNMVENYKGRVTGAPSGKTSYVVVGENAGPKKLETIAKLGIKILDEDQLLDLINNREGELDEKQKAKLKKDEDQIRKTAEEMTKKEKENARENASKVKLNGKGPVTDPRHQLWTTRYAPTALNQICGNKGNVEKLLDWLQNWSKFAKADFKKPGKNLMGSSRAVLITGPPGIGKTTSAHLCAQLAGYTPVELNASDARSKKLVENSTNISNTSLDGWMHGNDESTVAGVKITDKTCLIMDEVDGMSAGDRGGVGALNTLIKKTRIPIICIANDKRAIKLKPLQSTCFAMSFAKPPAAQIRARLMSIAYKEKLKIPGEAMDKLVEGANADIRSVLNMLSTWKLSHNEMDIHDGRALAAASVKHSIVTPYTVVDNLLGPRVFNPTSRISLNEKIEFYFHDHSFVPLFVQENYLKPTYSYRLGKLEGPEKDMKQLELMEEASRAISDGDLVDTMIHQGQQWGLMPLHAIHSTVRPAAAMYGQGAGYGSAQGGISFPGWLGQNSKQGKLQRQLNDVQIRMRLRVSSNKDEIRQEYIPALYPRLIEPLIADGAEAVERVIETMDEYYLSKDEWDTIVEIGLGDFGGDAVLKQIASTTKSSLTRKYNSSEHPIAFHKASAFQPPKKIAKGEAPDQEDILDQDDEADAPDDDVADEEDYDISKDKLIKDKAKPRKLAASSAKSEKTATETRGKGKAKSTK